MRRHSEVSARPRRRPCSSGSPAACLVALLLVAPAGAARAADDPLEAIERRQVEIFERLAPSVVFISSGEGFGSGFFVSSDGLVLTSSHVVPPGQQKVKLVLPDGSAVTGDVVERGVDGVDLALLRVPLAKTPALSLESRSTLRVGSWVAAVGHGRGGIWSFHTGIVSNIYPAGANRPVFQTQIPLNPGNSGGPIVDRRGRVVGIVTAGIEGSNSINFAIRTEVALRSLRGLEGACAGCLAITAPHGVPIFVDGKMIGAGPRQVHPVEAGTHEVFAVIGGVMSRRTVKSPETRTVDLTSAK